MSTVYFSSCDKPCVCVQVCRWEAPGGVAVSLSGAITDAEATPGFYKEGGRAEAKK